MDIKKCLEGKILLTVREVAEILNLNPSTVYKRSGSNARNPLQIKAVRLGSRTIRFRAEDVKKYLASL